MDVKAVNREFRLRIWTAMRDQGFDVHTGRASWRHGDGWVDVLEISSIGPLADACGCTKYSFGARIGSIPGFIGLAPSRTLGRDGRSRPHYWDCPLVHELHKTLRQPWFHPFQGPPRPTIPAALRKHRAALARILRKDVHDRANIWFVRDDGSNLDEAIEDLRGVIEVDGLPMLERFHDACAVIELVTAGLLQMTPDSPAALRLIEAARRVCPEQ